MPDHRATVNRTLRILVVDDEALIADYIAYLLKDAGHMIVGVAASGEEALNRLREVEADVAVVDIKLKGPIDGIQLVHEMRTHANIPHIFISGSGDPETLRRARDTLPLAFLQKPFDGRQLLAILGHLDGPR